MERGNWSLDRFDVISWFETVRGGWDINYDIIAPSGTGNKLSWVNAAVGHVLGHGDFITTYAETTLQCANLVNLPARSLYWAWPNSLVKQKLYGFFMANSVLLLPAVQISHACD